MPTVLLVHCDGTNGSTSFTDTWGAHTLTATSATVSTASPKFGTGCASFTAASTANINTGNAVDFNLGAGQFTVEAWGYIPTGVSGVQAIISQWGSSQRAWFFGFNGNTLNFFYSTTGSDNPAFTGSYTPPTNTWIHFAADRDASNNFRIYANGVVVASGNTSSTIFASTANCIIGNDLDFGTRAFPGFLDEVRVTKGTALYAGAFTPPTAPFADPVTTARATQVVSEQWIMPNANALASAVLLEMWAPGGTTTPRAVATLVALEQWASSGLVVTQQQARAWILA